jgi:hypothetical protein
LGPEIAMPQLPDEAERLFWIEAWMEGARAEWQDRADVVRLTLGMQPRESREVLVAALRVLGCGDLVAGDGPTRFESDASADYQRRLNVKRD